MAREGPYKTALSKRIEERLPGSVILKQDPNLRQGISDLLILWEFVWAALEVKAYRGAPDRPNQGYYVDLLNGLSYAAVIYPENEERILDELESTLRARQTAIRNALFPEPEQTIMGQLRRGQVVPRMVHKSGRTPRQ